jgi:hypothetical protein
MIIIERDSRDWRIADRVMSLITEENSRGPYSFVSEIRPS